MLSELPSVRPISPAEKPSVYGPHPLGTQQHLMLSHALREILELEWVRPINTGVAVGPGILNAAIFVSPSSCTATAYVSGSRG